MDVKIKTALISVSDKRGIVEFAEALAKMGVKIISTGGTAKALGAAGVSVVSIESVTGFPEMMDGRVKTLHPKVHGGLLALRDEPEHLKAMKEHGIEAIDVLYVNLYPFEATVARGADFDTCIENIDIGGPAMIRAALVSATGSPLQWAPAAAVTISGHSAALSFQVPSIRDSTPRYWVMRDLISLSPQLANPTWFTMKRTRRLQLTVCRSAASPHTGPMRCSRLIRLNT